MHVTSHRAAQDGVVRVVVSGELDMATSGDVARAIDAALAGGDLHQLTVDLGGVTFCDSSGISVLDEGFGAAAQQGVRLLVTEVRPSVRRVLEIVQLWDVLTRP